MKVVENYFPPFLYVTFGVWAVLFLLFIVLFIYFVRLPDDRIFSYKAKAIENKRRLRIKIYKF